VVNYRTEDLAGRIAEITDGAGVDVIYDPVGGDTAATALRSIARNGRIALVGLASGAPVALDAMDMLLRNYTAVGVLATPGSPEAEAAVWKHLADLAERGSINTPVGRVYDFDDVPQMITEQLAPGAGKSVVRVASK
jgi:NADPH2:quinone reductase